MIVLFTDFGRNSPYQGLLQNAIYQLAPEVKVLDLMADAPSFSPEASAYLLAALVKDFAPGTVFLAVVDPGVGSARKPCIVAADGYWFVGPDNGLFNVAAARAGKADWWHITWRPQHLSPTFHGRDLFAPVAARLQQNPACLSQLARPAAKVLPSSLEDECSIIYIDDYGNMMTGLRAASVPHHALLRINQHTIRYAKTFSEVKPGQAFWFENAFGLVEIAVNCASAARHFNCQLGQQITVIAANSS